MRILPRPFLAGLLLFAFTGCMLLSGCNTHGTTSYGGAPSGMTGLLAFGGSGFNKSGQPAAMLGTLNLKSWDTFDTGEIYYNNGGTLVTGNNLSGVWSFDSTGDRLQLQFNGNPVSPLQAAILLICYVNALQTAGFCTEEDANNFNMAIVFTVIAASANWQTDIVGPHISLTETRPAGTSEIDQFIFAGNNSGFGPTYKSMSGTGFQGPGSSTWSFTAPDSYQIGTLNQTAPSNSTMKYIHVSPTLTYTMQYDAGITSPLRFGTLYKQQGTFNAQTPGTIQAVGGYRAYDSTNLSPYSAAMQFKASSANSWTLSAYSSLNLGSHAALFDNSAGVPYSVTGFNTSTGLITLSQTGSVSGVPGLFSGFVLGGPSPTMLLQDATNTAANQGASGIFITQTGGPFSNTNMANKFVSQSSPLVAADWTRIQFGFSVNAGGTNPSYSGYYDVVLPGGTVLANGLLYTTPLTPSSGVLTPSTGAALIQSTSTTNPWQWNSFLSGSSGGTANGVVPGVIADFTNTTNYRYPISLGLAYTF
jgi:hypothetical protein